MPRLCVRGISSQTNPEDVRALFSKVCPVQEVYFPGPTSTGLRRDFAIVTVEGDSDAVKKCAKSLNGSLWKGARLSVEPAQEWYQDRLQRERVQHSNQDNDVSERPPPLPLPTFTGSIIRLRKLKLQEIPKPISLVPTLVVSGNRFRRKQLRDVVPCGIKVIFDEELLKGIDLESFSTEEATQAAVAEVQTQQSTAQSGQLSTVGAPVKTGAGPMAEIVQKLSSGAAQAIGGGARKGFGSLSVPSDAAKKVEHETTIAPSVVGGGVLGGKRGVDCCVEEHEQFSSNHLLDDEDGSDDDVPCVTEADVQAEALESERQRAMDVLNRLLAGDLPVKKDKKTLRKEAQEEKKRVSFAGAEADGEHQIVDEQVVASRGSEAEETLAILNELKAGGATAAPSSTPEVKKPSSILKKSVQGVSVTSANSAQQTAGQESRLVDELEIQSTKDGYADVSQLKNIFYREGGIWWGDDGTLKGAVAKGGAAADPLFLEAEKRGIDIRATSSKPAAVASIFNFALSGEEPAAGGVAPEAGGGSDNNMIFGFFSAPDVTTDKQSSVPAPSTHSNSAPTAAATAVQAATVPEKKPLQDALPTKGKDAGPTQVEKRVADSVSGPPSRPVLVDLTAAELVAMARKFGREKPVDVLNSEWRDGRDRLVLDYKRKRKDMKRRTAAWSSSNLSNVFGERERQAGSGGAGGEGGRPAGGQGSKTGPGAGGHYNRARGRGGVGRKKARKA